MIKHKSGVTFQFHQASDKNCLQSVTSAQQVHRKNMHAHKPSQSSLIAGQKHAAIITKLSGKYEIENYQFDLGPYS